DRAQKPFGKVLQLRRTDAVDLCELADRARTALRHVEQRAIGENQIGRDLPLLRDGEAKFFQSREKRRFLRRDGGGVFGSSRLPSRRAASGVWALAKRFVPAQKGAPLVENRKTAIAADIQTDIAAGHQLPDQ